MGRAVESANAFTLIVDVAKERIAAASAGRGE
jgi:hypothetical protein